MGRRKDLKRPTGRPPRPAGFSVARRDELLARKPEIAAYLDVVRRGIVRDICPEGPEHLSTARRILLDRLMSKLAWARLAEEYLAAYGLLRPDKLKEKTLEAHPLMAFWLSVNNQITKDLQILGLDRRALEVEVLTPQELLAEAAEEESKEARNCDGSSSEGRTEAGEGQGQADGASLRGEVDP